MHLCFILYISHVAAIMQPLFGIDHGHHLDHAVKLIAVCTTQTMQIHTACCELVVEGIIIIIAHAVHACRLEAKANATDAQKLNCICINLAG